MLMDVTLRRQRLPPPHKLPDGNCSISQNQPGTDQQPTRAPAYPRFMRVGKHEGWGDFSVQTLPMRRFFGQMLFFSAEEISDGQQSLCPAGSPPCRPK